MLTDGVTLFSAVGVEPALEALVVALFDEKLCRVERRDRDVAGRSLVELAPRALERDVVVHELAQALEVRIGSLAALLFVGQAAEVGEGVVVGKNVAHDDIFGGQVVAQRCEGLDHEPLDLVLPELGNEPAGFRGALQLIDGVVQSDLADGVALSACPAAQREGLEHGRPGGRLSGGSSHACPIGSSSNSRKTQPVSAVRRLTSGKFAETHTRATSSGSRSRARLSVR